MENDQRLFVCVCARVYLCVEVVSLPRISHNPSKVDRRKGICDGPWLHLFTRGSSQCVFTCACTCALLGFQSPRLALSRPADPRNPPAAQSGWLNIWAAEKREYLLWLGLMFSKHLKASEVGSVPNKLCRVCWKCLIWFPKKYVLNSRANVSRLIFNGKGNFCFIMTFELWSMKLCFNIHSAVNLFTFTQTQRNTIDIFFNNSDIKQVIYSLFILAQHCCGKNKHITEVFCWIWYYYDSRVECCWESRSFSTVGV